MSAEHGLGVKFGAPKRVLSSKLRDIFQRDGARGKAVTTSLEKLSKLCGDTAAASVHPGVVRGRLFKEPRRLETFTLFSALGGEGT